MEKRKVHGLAAVCLLVIVKLVLDAPETCPRQPGRRGCGDPQADVVWGLFERAGAHPDPHAALASCLSSAYLGLGCGPPPRRQAAFCVSTSPHCLMPSAAESSIQSIKSCAEMSVMRDTRLGS